VRDRDEVPVSAQKIERRSFGAEVSALGFQAENGTSSLSLTVELLTAAPSGLKTRNRTLLNPWCAARRRTSIPDVALVEFEAVLLKEFAKLFLKRLF
jgi:hypothetical protein